MNKIISLVMVLLLLVSCGSARKLQQNKSEIHVDSTATVKNVEVNVEKVVDTTRTEHGKITITEIEFYPTTCVDDVEGEKPDTNKVKPGTTPKATPAADIELSNVGKVKGNVKSIKQTVIETDVEDKGESKESSESNETENVANVSRNEETAQKVQEPTADPYRWRYIFYILLIGVAVLLYLKRVPILNWIKKILSGILKNP